MLYITGLRASLIQTLLAGFWEAQMVLNEAAQQ